MIFDHKDTIHLKNLMEMIRDKLVLNNLDCADISKVYKAFEWVQTLEAKLEAVKNVERTNEDLKEALENESRDLRQHIESLEAELLEASKPKRKARKKKA